MRNRDNSLHLRFSDKEWNYLKKQCERSGLRPQAYIRNLIYGYTISEQPPIEYYELLKEIRHIGSNLNQIALKANVNGFIDTAKYWQNIRNLEKLAGELREKIG